MFRRRRIFVLKKVAKREFKLWCVNRKFRLRTKRKNNIFTSERGKALMRYWLFIFFHNFFDDSD